MLGCYIGSLPTDGTYRDTDNVMQCFPVVFRINNLQVIEPYELMISLDCVVESVHYGTIGTKSPVFDIL